MAKPDILEHIAQLSRAMKRSPGGGPHLPRGHYKALELLADSPPMRASELADRLDVRGPSLSERLANLSRLGYIHREKDKADGRVTWVSITPAGAAQISQSRAYHQRLAARVQTVLSEAEAEAFVAGCGKLLAFFEAEAADAGQKDGGCAPK